MCTKSQYILSKTNKQEIIILGGGLGCGLPCLVVLGLFGALTKLKSASNDLPYTSQVALGLFGQCNAQASKVAHSIHDWNRMKDL